MTEYCPGCVLSVAFLQEEAAAAGGVNAGRDSLLSSFGPQDVAQLLVAAADLDLQLPLLPQLAALMQVRTQTRATVLYDSLISDTRRGGVPTLETPMSRRLAG